MKIKMILFFSVFFLLGNLSVAQNNTITWQVVYLDNQKATPAHGYAISTKDPNIHYAISKTVFYKSTDDGKTWVVMNEKAGKYMGWMNKLPIIIDPDDSDIIYLGHLMGVSISKDGGKTWDKKKVAPGICNLYMNPNNKKELVAGSAQAGGSGGVYISKDGGETWEQKLKNRTVQAVDVDPTDFRMMYAGTNTGNMEKSNDGGLTWRSKKPSKDENLSQMPNVLGITINPAQPNVILLAANLRGVFMSTDGGETWNPSSTGSNIDRDIKYNPTNPSEIWGISNPNFGLAGGAGSKVFFSKDAGKKFIDVGADKTITDFNKRQYDGKNAKFNAIYFSPDGKRVYLCTSTGVIFTDSRVVE